MCRQMFSTIVIHLILTLYCLYTLAFPGIGVHTVSMDVWSIKKTIPTKYNNVSDDPYQTLAHKNLFWATTFSDYLSKLPMPVHSNKSPISLYNASATITT